MHPRIIALKIACEDICMRMRMCVCEGESASDIACVHVVKDKEWERGGQGSRRGITSKENTNTLEMRPDG